MERLVPILMTALSAVLGLVPLALAAGKPGSELLAPLAIVTLGGLLTSVELTVFIHNSHLHYNACNNLIPVTALPVTTTS